MEKQIKNHLITIIKNLLHKKSLDIKYAEEIARLFHHFFGQLSFPEESLSVFKENIQFGSSTHSELPIFLKFRGALLESNAINYDRFLSQVIDSPSIVLVRSIDENVDVKIMMYNLKKFNISLVICENEINDSLLDMLSVQKYNSICFYHGVDQNKMTFISKIVKLPILNSINDINENSPCIFDGFCFFLLGSFLFSSQDVPFLKKIQKIMKIGYISNLYIPSAFFLPRDCSPWIMTIMVKGPDCEKYEEVIRNTIDYVFHSTCLFQLAFLLNMKVDYTPTLSYSWFIPSSNRNDNLNNINTQNSHIIDHEENSNDDENSNEINISKNIGKDNGLQNENNNNGSQNNSNGNSNNVEDLFLNSENVFFPFLTSWVESVSSYTKNDYLQYSDNDISLFKFINSVLERIPQNHEKPLFHHINKVCERKFDFNMSPICYVFNGEQRVVISRTNFNLLSQDDPLYVLFQCKKCDKSYYKILPNNQFLHISFSAFIEIIFKNGNCKLSCNHEAFHDTFIVIIYHGRGFTFHLEHQDLYKISPSLITSASAKANNNTINMNQVNSAQIVESRANIRRERYSSPNLKLPVIDMNRPSDTELFASLLYASEYIFAQSLAKCSPDHAAPYFNNLSNFVSSFGKKVISGQFDQATLCSELFHDFIRWYEIIYSLSQEFRSQKLSEIALNKSVSVMRFIVLNFLLFIQYESADVVLNISDVYDKIGRIGSHGVEANWLIQRADDKSPKSPSIQKSNEAFAILLATSKASFIYPHVTLLFPVTLDSTSITSILAFALASDRFTANLMNISQHPIDMYVPLPNEHVNEFLEATKLSNSFVFDIEENIYNKSLLPFSPKAHIEILFPLEFFALWSHFGISMKDMIESLKSCRSQILNGGKSGSSFFITDDKKFLLKTIKKAEMNAMSSFLPSYFKYMKKYQNSHLVHVFAVFDISVQCEKIKYKHHCILMENLNYGLGNGCKTYDFKGSTRGRLIDSNSVQLDTNYLLSSIDQRVIFSVNDREKFMKQLKKDARFLSKQNIMDYSLVMIVEKPKHLVRFGIVDYFRKYTIDKAIESMVKKTPLYFDYKQQPTIISPELYCKRFVKILSTYFYASPIGSDQDQQ
ncbi:hypothetical protein TRFO_23390 [Tritrichomonas foetus]|uniref:PIPK domain-containing protein n=1 Tax=Tritrichomonas foetus TaxID=1144522 RepID=A0A1J4KEK5_9EUKA|nr:hypothetical protein TRFO_23390 [Tritrichomonas foetus]|eukprot:OHT08180.1 hypothetical protein TRFO_23390 [Tritrichomonas foetus]